jgi:hypothetical protein
MNVMPSFGLVEPTQIKQLPPCPFASVAPTVAAALLEFIINVKIIDFM